MALQRIGARGQITSINDNSPNAVKVLTCWDAVFQEVLTERDWRFAKTRSQLQPLATTPLYGYQFAYGLPSDFLRFVRPHKVPADLTWYFESLGPPGTSGWYPNIDRPFWPPGFKYIVETLPPVVSGTFPDIVTADQPMSLLTNYDGSSGPLMINYIRLISDYSQLMPGFVNALISRLAMELAIAVTEDKQKREEYKADYRESLNSAEAQNESYDLVSHDEQGSESWRMAGRYVRWVR
jgi:hypothetical protein